MKPRNTTNPTYSSWFAMKRRCKAHPAYVNIEVCDRWQKYDNFYEDMGDRPIGHTLDRIDGTKGYYPQNCRWATASQQRINQRPRTFTDQAKANISAGITAWHASRIRV